jgi:hypothetical protein
MRVTSSSRLVYLLYGVQPAHIHSLRYAEYGQDDFGWHEKYIATQQVL